jgi:hypothetical protein
MSRILRAWCALTVILPCCVFAHGNKDATGKPTKAQPQLNRAARLAVTLKKKAVAAGKHQCCTKSSCEMCSRAKGDCSCAQSLSAKHAVCGDCLERWKNAPGRDQLTVLTEVNESYERRGPSTQDAEVSTLIRQYDAVMLDAKRTLTTEKRYTCCIRGGCNTCAMEGGCACGANLATGKGVCGECLQGWHGGKGAFPGIEPSTVTLSSEEMTGVMAGLGMGPGGGAASGWYSSGTSQEPREAGMPMASLRRGAWDLMWSGQAFLTYTEQTGLRGKSKIFAPNWMMGMASRKVGPGVLTLRSMLSLEPATITQGRYPLLFATGETAFGIPIVNGQHPHDFLMELAASYQIGFGERTTLTLYGGPRGEPALGPPAYPHRASASENPVAVLGHHIQDSTHVANHVVTAGITHRAVTWEVSAFHGREPGEQRWGLDKGTLDSWSSRLTVTPTSRWSGQISVGRLANREFIHPGRPALRTTASLSYSREFANSGGRWSSMILWGRNHDLPYTQQPSAAPVFSALASRRVIRPQHFVLVPTRIPGQIYNSFLAESTLRIGRRNWVWGRAENADRDTSILYEESLLLLLVDEQRYGRVQAYTAGYERLLSDSARWLRPGIGAQVTFYRAPAELAAVYGNNARPVGVQVFLKVRLGSGVR